MPAGGEAFDPVAPGAPIGGTPPGPRRAAPPAGPPWLRLSDAPAIADAPNAIAASAATPAAALSIDCDIAGLSVEFMP
jgi:hypothetical protein